MNPTIYNVIMAVLLMANIVISAVLCRRLRRYWESVAEQRYIAGLADGSRVATEEAVRQAIAADRLALKRKLTDSGRRNMARPDAAPAKIHRAQIAPAPPLKKNKPR